MTTVNAANTTPYELLKQAQKAVELESAPAELAKTLPPLLMSIANGAIAKVAPDEQPEQAARRLSAERNNHHIQAAYNALLWYYEDSLDPSPRSSYDDPLIRLNLVDVTEDLLKMLAKDAIRKQ